MTREIPLTQGKVAIIDEGDFELVSRYRWHAHKNKAGNWYACTKGTTMHRLIMGSPWIDHRDGDGLNNRRGNLRKATQTQNNMNRRPKGQRRFKGTYLRRDTGLWRAFIGFNKKFINLGHYKTEVEAARAYDKAALKLFGPFSRLNFPERTEEHAIAA